MAKNLVIVESPAKAKTIEKFLGKDFEVKSSFGHIRDLSKKDFGIDIENNYQPIYEISPDKKKIVAELKKSLSDKTTVWLASDEDREGEAIAWHLFEVLKLQSTETKRIVFHEITKTAIEYAISNPRKINLDLVNAQQARRVLDRLVGFELSPILWKKVRPSLSAGRVQSVAVRLIVEREREIQQFSAEGLFRVKALFEVEIDGQIKALEAELEKRFKTAKETIKFLESCINASFTVSEVVQKPSKRSPAAPFTTSTLQQEASRKFGFSVSQTMRLAQNLYESGHITYMRTDSTNLSELALNSAETEIKTEFGAKYHQKRTYKSKAIGAQEAHEAIRPSYMNVANAGPSAQEKKLYDLIRKRTLASQMTDAQFERTQITIIISNNSYRFFAKGEVLIFDGFLKVYTESTDDEQETNEDSQSLPPLKAHDKLDFKQIEAREKFSLQAPRYTEASLVKKLEELGIGRPSTYAPTISTVQNRGYVVKDTREGVSREYQLIKLNKSGKINESIKTEQVGAEKNKLFPTDIGIVVTDFLVEHFENLMQYNFTADIEEQFDKIAMGKTKWPIMIDKFYKPFHVQVDEAMQVTAKKIGNRLVGNHPESNEPIYAKIGRFGPYIQIGENPIDGQEQKPKYASLRTGQHIDTISMDEALELFKLPRELGEFESKKIVAAIGRFGPYLRHNNKFISLKKYKEDPFTINLDRAIELIKTDREEDAKKTIKVFEDEDIKILNGRFGPYITQGKTNFKIPKSIIPENLLLEDCLKIIAEAGPKKNTTTKKNTEEKKPAKSSSKAKTKGKK